MSDYSYLLIGGDKRQEYLYNLISEKNAKTDAIFLQNKKNIQKELDKIEGTDVIILPIPSTTDGTTLYSPMFEEKILLHQIIERISNKSILFTGGENNLFTASKAKKVINLLSNEAMTLKNAMATAEAALAIIINNTEHTVFESEILITGYGRIGKILTNYLLSLKANVSICARSEIARTEAKLSGANAFGFDKLVDAVPKFNIIINTIPMLIFKKNELEKIKSDTLIIDLASKPGGIDLNVAKFLELNVIHALSLPGKFSPKTAAKFIEETINNTLI